MALKEISFSSYNQRDTVKGWAYSPLRKARAVVQIVHGLGEHSRRYLHMILKMNEAGFAVYADDHTGHGKTAMDSGIWGDYGDRGFMTTIEDEKTLYEISAKDYPSLPHIMFGHSWGSMIARGFAASYGSLLKGMVVCGTCGRETAAAFLKELKALVDAGKGEEREPDYPKIMTARWSDRYEDTHGFNDYASSDPDIVAEGRLDPFNNHYSAPTIRATYDLACLAEYITGLPWAEKVPKTLKVYNIAGDQDPNGSYGEGVYAVSNWLAQTGHKVTTKLYSGHRHSFFDDRDIREEVIDGIIDFINSLCE
ncbi:MAG: alpha/beta hydrolase [Treponema sp.]|jgi:alpha-beta hydrolase superfamily lysophospholipase|nr:alpha/beta hydrolase [Treponema sp.]